MSGAAPAKGFLTDVSLCIGCKACEVACRIWNEVPEADFEWRGPTYDHTGELGACSWRHVKFLELPAEPAEPAVEEEAAPDLLHQELAPSPDEMSEDPFRWVFASDVCKHCAVAGCLEACPTGALVRTEVSSVLVQDDICNGCGYCVVTCPFGVIDRRPNGAPSEQPRREAQRATARTPSVIAATSAEPLPGAGGAFKCTFCLDRQAGGLEPACATVCPTESIRFGEVDALEERGHRRVEELQQRGESRAFLYDGRQGSVDQTHSLFVLFGEARDYGLPEAPQLPQRLLGKSWAAALLTAAAALLAAVLSFGGLGG
ncbi:MAG: 4Fe-4S dicluster domain-containing protein [Acidobacteriota bacterium]